MAELRPEESATVAGRLVELNQNGRGRIADESACIDVEMAAAGSRAATGDIVEIEGTWTPPTFRANRIRLLAPATGSRENHPMSVRQAVRTRAETLTGIRSYFGREGFLEVETPVLVRCPGMEPHLTAFETGSREAGGPNRLYLPTSPEYAMKRLLGAGFERIYQVCKAFRDELPAPMHNPEFTILEWYRAYADYSAAMADTESLVHSLAVSVAGGPVLEYRGLSIDTTPPWERITVTEAFARFAGIALGHGERAEDLVSQAREKGHPTVSKGDSYDDAFYKVFLDNVEPHLGRERPVLLTDYPASMAALAKIKPDQPHLAERFEAYIGGVELANGFTELNDPEEQRRRLVGEARQRQQLGAPVYPIDEQFIGALRGGIPLSGGVALGVDRLIMLLTGSEHIRDVLAFPFPEI